LPKAALAKNTQPVVFKVDWFELRLPCVVVDAKFNKVDILCGTV